MTKMYEDKVKDKKEKRDKKKEKGEKKDNIKKSKIPSPRREDVDDDKKTFFG